ncbi:MAG: hypothetical protein ABSF29_00820 [Tepidisphaeraceae bacterium]|jgi:hypothetical protein
MSNVTDPDLDRAALADAKSELIAAARAFDPLSTIRKRPLISLGVAAGIGLALGMNEERVLSKKGLERVFSLVERVAGFALAAAEMSSRPQSAATPGKSK